MSGRAMWILYGALLGIDHVVQRLVRHLAAPEADPRRHGQRLAPPRRAQAGRRPAGKASRFNTYASGPLLFAMLAAPHFSLMSGPVLLVVTVIGVGFWFGMIKRSFKVKTTV